MFSEVCKIGPFTVYSYGLALAFAFLASSALARLEAKKQHINPDYVFNLVFICFFSGIIGARIFYVIQNFGGYMSNPLEIIMLQHGGLSWIGGLTLAVIAGILYLKKKKMPVFNTLDLLAPFVAFGQAIGRVGCLLNGCCFGKVSESGIYFPAHKQVLIPTQIYSSLMLIFIFIILRSMQARPHKQGEIFFAYLLMYSIKRFFIEFWRGDSMIMFLGLSLFQITSIIVFCIAVFGLILIRKPSQ